MYLIFFQNLLKRNLSGCQVEFLLFERIVTLNCKKVIMGSLIIEVKIKQEQSEIFGRKRTTTSSVTKHI